MSKALNNRIAIELMEENKRLRRLLRITVVELRELVARGLLPLHASYIGRAADSADEAVKNIAQRLEAAIAKGEA